MNETSTSLTAVPLAALATLPASARGLVAASLSPNTRRAYARSLHRLDRWLTGRPLDDAHLATYVAHLFDAGLSACGSCAARCRRKAPRQTRRRRPAPRRRPPRVSSRVSDARGAIGAEVRSLVFAGSRPTQRLHSPNAALLRGFVMPPSSRSRATPCSGLPKLQLSTLKTSQSRPTAPADSRFGIRRPTRKAKARSAFIGAPGVRRLRAWLAAIGAEMGAMFRRVRRGGHAQPERMTARAIRTVIAKRASDAGVEGRISGHSPRVGSAQSLAAAGASVVEMQTVGRWKSPTMPGRYSRGQLAARGAVARLRYGGLTFLERASSCVTSAERSREEESRNSIEAELRSIACVGTAEARGGRSGPCCPCPG